MSLKPFILTSTGIVIPSNSHYSILTKEHVTNTSTINKNTASVRDYQLLEVLGNKEVYHSEEAKNILNNYEELKTPDSYLRLVDFTADILYSITPLDFLKAQVANNNISPFVFNMILDIFTYKLNKNNYINISPNIRFTSDKNVQVGVLEKRKEILNKAEKSIVNNMEQALANLFEQEDIAKVCFTVLFVDNY